MKPHSLVILAVGLGLAATALEAGRDPAGHGKVPPAQATGPARSCIRLAEVTNSAIRDDWTVDFERGSSRRVYRTSLPHRCLGLRAANTFSYETSLSELCSTDLIHPVYQGGGLNRGPGCVLGKFTPMDLERR